MSLRARIAAVAGLAVAVAVLAAAAGVYVGVRGQLREEVDVALERRANALLQGGGRPGPRRRFGGRGGLRRGGPPGPGGFPGGPLPPGPEELPFGGAGSYAQVVLADGSVVRPPGALGDLPVTREARVIAAAGAGRRLADQDVAGTHLRVLTAGAGPAGALQVARPLDEVDRQLARVLTVLVVVGLGGIALGAGLGAAVAQAALAPVRRFTSRTEAIAAAPDPARRMEAEGDDELARLARSFNATLDALERSVEAQRHLVADASHELRTPMASLRANVQVLLDADRLPASERRALRDDVLAELDELTALVGDVVELARGAKPAEAPGDVRLDAVVAAAAERAERRGGVRVEVDAAPAVVRGDGERIARAVANLLDNAVKWSPADGTVEVTLRDGVVAVRDHGPGFAPEDLPHVFERFYRADRARGTPGSGLGLAIVRQAAEAHGGWAEASAAPGGGALLRASFGPAIGVDAATPA